MKLSISNTFFSSSFAFISLSPPQILAGVVLHCIIQVSLTNNFNFIHFRPPPSSNPFSRFSGQINCSILGLGFQHSFQQHTCVSTILEFSNNNMLMHNSSAYFVLLRKNWQLFHNAIRFLDSFLL